MTPPSISCLRQYQAQTNVVLRFGDHLQLLRFQALITKLKHLRHNQQKRLRRIGCVDKAAVLGLIVPMPQTHNTNQRQRKHLMSSSSALPLSTYRAHAQSLNDALSRKKKELVAARLARTRAVGAGPPGPRSPCPAARSVGMRSRHVQVCFGGWHFEKLIVYLVAVVDAVVVVVVAVARCCRYCFFHTEMNFRLGKHRASVCVTAPTETIFGVYLYVPLRYCIHGIS